MHNYLRNYIILLTIINVHSFFGMYLSNQSSNNFCTQKAESIENRKYLIIDKKIQEKIDHWLWYLSTIPFYVDLYRSQKHIFVDVASRFILGDLSKFDSPHSMEENKKRVSDYINSYLKG